MDIARALIVTKKLGVKGLFTLYIYNIMKEPNNLIIISCHASFQLVMLCHVICLFEFSPTDTVNRICMTCPIE